jgi:hypothetical protein
MIKNASYLFYKSKLDSLKTFEPFIEHAITSDSLERENIFTYVSNVMYANGNVLYPLNPFIQYGRVSLGENFVRTYFRFNGIEFETELIKK